MIIQARVVKTMFRFMSSDREFITKEINHFKLSQKRKDMITGEKYYDGKHDILNRRRTVIGEGGDLIEVENLPNNRIVDNQYTKMVDQKNNYLLGQPFVIQTKNKLYAKALRQVFNKKFRRLLKGVGEDSLNCGIGWMFIHYDEEGKLCFKKFKPFEIIPGWKDAEHTVLEYAIRIYDVVVYEKKREKVVHKCEVYDETGISFFDLSETGGLVPTEPYF